MTKTNILKAINSNPEVAFGALSTLYHNRTYIVYTELSNDVRIEKYCKTKRGAEGYIKRQQGISWYDDYTQEMVRAGGGLEVIEIKDYEIVDPTTDKKIWYLYLKKMFSKGWMLDNVLWTAKKIIIDVELLQWVKDQIEEIKETGSFLWIEEFEEKEDLDKVLEIEIIEEVNKEAGTEEIEVIKSSIEVEISFNEEKNGIELKFDGKPSDEIRANLKVNGFRWSKYQKIWYAKDTAERREFIKVFDSTITESEPKTFEYPEINIDDLEDYTIDSDLSRRENNGNWIFRTKERNHNHEIQSILGSYQNQVIEILNLTDDKDITYYIKRDLQRFKKAYHSNYIAMLANKANNPSWAVTGRAGRNRSKDQKANNRYDNLMLKSFEIVDKFEKILSRNSNKIRAVARKETYNNIENTDLEIDFKVETKQIDYMNIKQDLRTYSYKEYMIVKLWGCYRIFKDEKEIKSLRTTDTLATAKKALQFILDSGGFANYDGIEWLQPIEVNKKETATLPR